MSQGRNLPTALRTCWYHGTKYRGTQCGTVGTYGTAVGRFLPCDIIVSLLMPRSQGWRFSFPPREGQPSRRLACAGVLAALGALARGSTSNASTTARVPCRFVGGERHCDESKAVPCSRRRRGCFPKLLGSLDRTFGRCSTSVHIMLTPGEPRAMILWCCLLGARRGDAFPP